MKQIIGQLSRCSLIENPSPFRSDKYLDSVYL